jgi:hypothetical protein
MDFDQLWRQMFLNFEDKVELYNSFLSHNFNETYLADKLRFLEVAQILKITNFTISTIGRKSRCYRRNKLKAS